jgi:D-threo-aldose 1-dehydrogenase
VGVVLGGVFNSGLLADPHHNTTYDYVSAPDALVARARAMARACSERGVSLTAAALQFALRHPAVSAVVVGARSAAEVRVDVAAATAPIPDDLWDTLAAL